MNKKGIALILGFLVIVVLAILGGAVLTRTISENRVAQRYVESMQAFWLAEAGVNRALSALRMDFNTTAIANTPLGRGSYQVGIVATSADNRTVVSTGSAPLAAPFIQRTIQAVMTKFEVVPPDFYDNAIYSSGGVQLNGNAYDILGNVTYAGSINNNTARINGTIKHDESIDPLAHLNFDKIKNISISQGNYHNATQLGGPFPSSFWYNASGNIPNVVFLEGNLELRGNEQIGGFFVVGGDVLCNSTLGGNVDVEGAIYSLGTFTINGGGNRLNVNGGIWSGELSLINGNGKVDYNRSYMQALKELDLDSTVQITFWNDTQNPYTLTP